MRLLRVGNITLDEPLFLESEFYSNKITAKSDEAIDGTEIVFEARTKNEALNFTHKNIAWQKRETIQALIALADTSIGKNITVQTDALSIEVRFDYTKNAVKGEELFAGGSLFLVEIYLKRI